MELESFEDIILLLKTIEGFTSDEINDMQMEMEFLHLHMYDVTYFTLRSILTNLHVGQHDHLGRLLCFM